MQNQFNEGELLNLINRFSEQVSLFQDKNSKQTQVIILIGVTGAGKSTLFNFLSGAEFEMNGQETQQYLNIKDSSQQFAVIKGGMKSITKSPNYFYSQVYNTLIIDFPGFQDTEGNIDQVLVQLLFYQFVQSANVKIVYVIKHPETCFNGRGNKLQDFIRQTFQGQNFEMSQICLMLNCYNDKLPDDKLILNVQGQLEQIYRCKPQNICVMRKIKNNSEIKEYLTTQKREFLLQQFLKSDPVTIFPQYIPQSESISPYLSEKSEQILEQLCSILDKNLNYQIESLDYEQIIKLEKYLKQLTILLKNQKQGQVEWFQELINQLIRSTEILNCQNKINQSYLNFVKIYNFFAQYSEYISGYEDIRHNGIIAQEKCENIVKIFQGKVDLLVKQRELLEVQEQKKIELQERQKAEQTSLMQAQLASQAQQSFQQQQVLHQNTQNNYNQGLKEMNEFRLQQQGIIYQSKILEANQQKQQEENDKLQEELKQSNQNYDNQLNTFSNQYGSMKNELEMLSTKFQEIQTQNLSEREKNEKLLNEMEKSNEVLKNLENDLLLSKQDLLKMLQNNNNDISKLFEEVERLAKKRNKVIFCGIF